MGHDHAHDHEEHFVHDSRVLKIVLLLNCLMFVLEIWQGLKADSTSLLADSMDFLSDAFSAAITLYVLKSHLHVRASAALGKACLMLLLAAAALAQGAHNLISHELPEYFAMGWVGTLALIVNVTCATILYSARGRDSNMRSVWMCCRNDAIANIAIIIAAGLVYETGSLWPDLLVALVIAGLEGGSALKIISHAKKELKTKY